MKTLSPRYSKSRARSKRKSHAIAARPAACFVRGSLIGVLLCLPSFCRAGDLAFRKHIINADSEYIAAAAFDVNKDGKLDIACGGYWYEAPTWKKHFLRKVEIRNGRPDGYAHQVIDVNNDGWPDIVTVNWRTGSIKWIEHPGKNLVNDPEWKAHVVATPGAAETGRFIDLLGDGTPALLPCGANYAAWWELRRPATKGGNPEWIRHELPRELAGHGIGAGDINGDGRTDIVGRRGWAEAPQDRRNGRWIWHADFDLETASIPILVVDVDGDGLNDIVYTRAHDYGVYWLQQQRTKSKQIRWVKHAIDTSIAGAHAPLWVDLDGDGVNELVIGRRYLAHEGRDPGEYDPLSAYRYQFDRKTRTWHRWLISYNDGIGFGVDPKAVDLTGSGKLDLVCGGRHGLYWLENLGPGNSIAKGLTNDPLRYPDYADHGNLLVVKDQAFHEKPVRTPFDWGNRRAHVLAALQSVLGPLPDPHERVPLDMKVVSETPMPDYVRKKITYGSDLATRASAYLLIPNKVRRGSAAMLCLHDDTPLGKDEPAGLGGRASMHYADELAKRGYVCLVPDYPSYGDNRFDLSAARKTYASGSMKAVWDNIRGIDLLETLTEVNPKRIGVIGHGMGGVNALFTAALDYRIAAVISSCGVTPFASYKGGDLTDWAKPRLAPRIESVYHNNPARIPFDFPELLGTLAPRPVFINAPKEDSVIAFTSVKTAVHAAAPIYELRRAGRLLQAIYPQNGRGFTAEARAQAYDWLDRVLKR